MSNNIIAINRNPISLELMQRPHGPASFDVATVPLMYFNENGEWHHSSKVAVVRTDTLQELGVHGQNYKPIAPKDMIDTVRTIIMRSDLNTDGIRENIQTSHCGSRTFVSYDLPGHTYETPDGDSASLKLLGLTSFDGTWPFMLSVSARQFACTNTQVFISGGVAIFKAKHTKNLDIDHGARTIVKCLDVFNQERELWADMYRTSVTEKQAILTIAQAAGCRKWAEVAMADSGVSWSAVFDAMPKFNSAFTYMAEKWPGYKHRLGGSNQWALYNTLTDWSSHAPASRKSNQINIANVQRERQETVRKVVGSDVFRIAA